MADSAFNLIQNLNAFQNFPPADLTRIVGVHAQALKPGGVAVFDGIEQGERQEAVERALEEAGLFLPMLRYNRDQAARHPWLPVDPDPSLPL